MLCFLLLAETQHRRASSCHAPKRYVVGVGRSVVKFLSGLHSSSGLQRVSARVVRQVFLLLHPRHATGRNADDTTYDRIA